MAFRLEVQCGETGLGDQLAVVGGSADFGLWEPSKAIRLETSADLFPVWAASVSPAILNSEFKIIILRSSGQITWEAIPNRMWRARANSPPYGSALRTTFDIDNLEVKLQERQSRITFKATVSVSEVPHLGITDLRNELWWSQEDFQEFLRVRMALMNEYKEAVKHRRLRASGSWDIQDPLLKLESRRGLGLGRMKLRQNNTRAYLASIVNEQSRQRRDVGWGANVYIDEDKLAEAGRRISESDVKASIVRAQRDHEDVRKDLDVIFASVPEKIEEDTTDESTDQPEQEPNAPASEASDESPAFGMKRVESITLVDHGELFDEDDGASSMASGLSGSKMPDMSKGFGLSREVLEDAGLRANGRKDDSVCFQARPISNCSSATDLQNVNTLLH